MFFVSLGFIGLIAFSALDHRFAWSHMLPYVAPAGDALVVLGWLAIFFVFKENTFTFATIELAPDQRVISTGPYALVRHPMYAGALVMLLGIPIALGFKTTGDFLVIPVLLFGPPIALLLFGLAAGWAFRGFRAENDPPGN